MKLSKEKLESLIRDEKEAIRKYEPLARRGGMFYSIYLEERRHLQILERMRRMVV